MFMLPGHGAAAVPDNASYAAPKIAMRLCYACGYTDPATYPDDPTLSRFGYLFPDAPEMAVTPETTAQLDQLARAMVQPSAEPQDSSIPPVFTYFGQFIDHDITANTDREVGLSQIDAAVLAPAPRAQVERDVQNLRHGVLNLDSVYGGGPVMGPLANALADALRHPTHREKLRVGTVATTGTPSITVPKDPAKDLLRLERLLRDADSPLSKAAIAALPADMAKVFQFADGSLRRQRAILGDMRNDENLVVAQFHLSIVRLHNRIVDHMHQHPDAPKADADARFAWARQRTTWHYQWLVANTYLPAVCDAQIVADVQAKGPRLYNEFFKRVGGAAPLLPLPLEFSVAAFRFGHTMVRDVYDWNANFPAAEFRNLFFFTGNGTDPMTPRFPGDVLGPQFDTLPDNWPIDWARFVHTPTVAAPHRSARAIDTRIAPPLSAMANEETGASGKMADLPARNLRRGLRLNLPSAQALIAEIQAAHGISIPTLPPQKLRGGPTDAAVALGGFEHETPLWFYILREAEVLGQGGRLGPLGSRLVADTIMGLIVNDPDSYWQQGTIPGGWHPENGVKPDGVVIQDMAALMRAARVLA